MADLNETVAAVDEFDAWVQGIYQLEQEDLVLGGADGIDNLQAKQLLARSNWLKAQVLSLGADKQPLDAMLTALAALVTAADQTLYFTGPDAPALTALTAYARTLIAAADADAARATLGAASPADIAAAIAALVNSSPATLDTLNELAAALGNDANFATTMANALALKAALESPEFTGTPTAPTPAQFDNDNSLATTSFVKRAMGAMRGIAGKGGAGALSAADVGMLVELNAAAVQTLPAANTVPSGEGFLLHSTIVGAAVARAGADVIYTGIGVNSVTSLTINRGEHVLLLSNGANAWYIAGGSAALSFADVFGSSIAAFGYQKLPSGLIVQWGTITTGAGGAFTWTFPITFPNSRLSEAVGLMPGNNTVIATGGGASSRSGTLTVANTGAGAGSGVTFQMIVIGH